MPGGGDHQGQSPSIHNFFAPTDREAVKEKTPKVWISRFVFKNQNCNFEDGLEQQKFQTKGNFSFRRENQTFANVSKVPMNGFDILKDCSWY